MTSSTPPPDPTPAFTKTEAKAANREEQAGLGSAPEFKEKPITWLGMHFSSKEASKLYETIIQSIGQEIQKDQQAMITAMKQMREDMEDQS